MRDGQSLLPRARVLVVDDSVVARGLFSRWISEHPRLDLAGSAADGVNAIAMAGRLQPELIILDLDMPVMDGLTALPEILRVSPASAVIVASSLTARSARLSMQCLALGAVELQPKPESNRDLTMSMTFRQEMLRKLEGLIGAKPGARREHRLSGVLATPAGTPAPVAPPMPAAATALLAQPPGATPDIAQLRFEVTPRALLIGASTGGPRAITALLEGLGASCDRWPVLVAQHMPALFTASFAEQLAARIRRNVREAIHGEPAIAGTVYIAPGGRHMRLDRSDSQVRIVLDDTAPVKFCRPSVDLLFSDAAAVYGASALAVVLTGMGNDGLDGVRMMRSAGSRILVQDEATSVVWGMPGAVSRAGLAHHVLPIQQIGPTISAAIQQGARP